MSGDPRPYRPSNGTEGEAFLAKFCRRCARDNFDLETFEGGCRILADTMAFELADPSYPAEWIQRVSQIDGDWAITCIAFTPRQQVAA